MRIRFLKLTRLCRQPLTWICLAAFALLATGCHTMYERRSGRSSSVVAYLQPPGSEVILTPAIPRLALPLQVGVAWVPQQSGTPGLTAVQQMQLADQIRQRFEALPFVARVTTVPTGYLQPRGGWTNLEQVGRMLGLDVIVLLGYDQVHITESTLASLSVWTIVGAYVVPSERRGTHTLLEASVFDVNSRQLLFRAPGVHTIERKFGTFAEADGIERDHRERGFAAAMDHLVGNLHSELNHFQHAIRTMPESVEIVHRPGYTGAGALPHSWIAALLAGLGLIMGARRHRNIAHLPQ